MTLAYLFSFWQLRAMPFNGTGYITVRYFRVTVWPEEDAAVLIAVPINS